MKKFRIKLGISDVQEMKDDIWTLDLSEYNVDSIINICTDDHINMPNYKKFLFNHKSKRLDIIKSSRDDMFDLIIIEFYSTIEERNHKIEVILN